MSILESIRTMLDRLRKIMGTGRERGVTPPIRRAPKQWKEYAAQNGVMFQFFHWEYPADGSLWRELSARAPELATAGCTHVWIPPATKGAGGANDNGYGAYDLFDLGEFDQKGGVRTKYGTKKELVEAVKAAHDAGLSVFADVVLNHKDGGDNAETVPAREVAWDDRNRFLTKKHDIQTYTRFTFPGRRGKYSKMQWNWHHFTGACWNIHFNNAEHLYVFGDKKFSGEVSKEFGTYDYLMGCDIDFYNDEVRGECKHWGEWFLETTGVDGFRLDAVKHIPHTWFPHWLGHLRKKTGKELFAVGEYLSRDVDDMLDYLHVTDGCMSLFDFALHHNLHEASQQGPDKYPMNCLLENTLVAASPLRAVTFADNHDTQPGQAIEPPVESWFKPHAYAIILLRGAGFPCVFYADYYGARYTVGDRDIEIPAQREMIDKLLEARRIAGWGERRDYFDHPRTVGWVRLGDKDHPRAMAVVLTNGTNAWKTMETERPTATFTDITGNIADKITTDAGGKADFRCPDGGVSVWIQDE